MVEKDTEEQYEEDESWEEKGFLKGMEEADSDKKKNKQPFFDELEELESDEFPEDF